MKKQVLLLLSILFMFLFLGAACAPIPLPHTSDYVLRNSHGQALTWPSSSFPIEIIISDNLDSEQEQGVLAAINDWNQACGVRVFYFGGITSHPYRLHGPGQVLIMQDSLGDLPGGYIIQGLTENREYIYEPGSIDYSIVWIEQNPDRLPRKMTRVIVRHELGHVLGAGHDPDEHSIMFWMAIKSAGIIEPGIIDSVHHQMLAH